MTVTAPQLADPILKVGEWEAREMILTWDKVEALWHRVSRIRALFSDLTQGDFRNFFSALTNRNTVWIEIWKEEELVGMLWLADIHMMIDATAHMMFLDSKPGEKKAVVKQVLKWVFRNYPLHRITVFVPEPYHTTQRLTRSYGFKYEGLKRESILLNGVWHNLLMFGLTRADAEKE